MVNSLENSCRLKTSTIHFAYCDMHVTVRVQLNVILYLWSHHGNGQCDRSKSRVRMRQTYECSHGSGVERPTDCRGETTVADMSVPETAATLKRRRLRWKRRRDQHRLHEHSNLTMYMRSVSNEGMSSRLVLGRGLAKSVWNSCERTHAPAPVTLSLLPWHTHIKEQQ